MANTNKMVAPISYAWCADRGIRAYVITDLYGGYVGQADSEHDAQRICDAINNQEYIETSRARARKKIAESS